MRCSSAWIPPYRVATIVSQHGRRHLPRNASTRAADLPSRVTLHSRPMAVRAEQTNVISPDAEQVLLAMDAARERTLALVAGLDDEQLERVHSPIMSPLVWDLGHIAAYEDLWLAHRHGGLELLRPELATLYDAFETPRAVRGEIEALGPADAKAYMAAVSARVARGDRRARRRRRRAVRDGAAPRAPALRDDATDDGHRRPAARRGAGEDRRAAGSARAGRGLAARFPREPSRWAPRRTASPTTTSARATPSRCRRFAIARRPVSNAQLDALQRGRRLRAARVVVARGLGVEAGARHHPSSGHRRGPPGGARLPRLLVRGRRLRPRTRRAAAHRGGVGEGGELDPAGSAGRRRDRPGCARARRRRARVGVDRLAIPAAIRASSPTPTASTRRCSSERTTACCGAGSWATHPRVASRTFRNWDLPQRRQIFAGVRLAREA